MILFRIPESIIPINYNCNRNGIRNEIIVLIESFGDDNETDEIRLNKFINNILENNLVIDAVLSQDSVQEKVKTKLIILI